MSNPKAAFAERRTEIAQQLCRLLAALITLRSEAGVEQAEISLDTEFTSLALTSVDFLEFVLMVEQEFGVEIPDDALTEKRLLSLAAWAEYLVARLEVGD